MRAARHSQRNAGKRRPLSVRCPNHTREQRQRAGSGRFLHPGRQQQPSDTERLLVRDVEGCSAFQDREDLCFGDASRQRDFARRVHLG